MQAEVATDLIERLCASPDDPRPAPSVAVVVAHPDDEVIGAGGRFPRICRNVSFIHVTGGSPKMLDDAVAAGFSNSKDYADARRRELECALSVCGINRDRCFEFGIVDQEASFNLVDISHRLFAFLKELAPEVILTLPYEGGHPDHDSVAFAVHSACDLIARSHEAPQIIEFTMYHASPEGAMAVVEFLPDDRAPVTTVQLTEAERALKQGMVDCFPSQARMLQAFPIDIERFRPAPRYDFSEAPHEGPLYYERFDWGVTGAGWRSLARLALLSLHQPGSDKDSR